MPYFSEFSGKKMVSMSRHFTKCIVRWFIFEQFRKNKSYWLYKQYWLYEPFLSSLFLLGQISAQGELRNLLSKIFVEFVSNFCSYRQICSNSLTKPLEGNFILYAIMFLMDSNRPTTATESDSKLMIKNYC